VFLLSESKQVDGRMKEAETGRCYTDKLVKVCLLDGSEQFVLCHIEGQSPELLRDLGQALLGWDSIDDLTAWLDRASPTDS
jgi:hypothetical protein